MTNTMREALLGVPFCGNGNCGKTFPGTMQTLICVDCVRRLREQAWKSACEWCVGEVESVLLEECKEHTRAIAHAILGKS